MPIHKQWVLARKPRGLPQEEDFELREDHTPDLKKGEILCRALFLSIDPITRLYMSYGMREGDVFPGRQVARIVDSKHRDFPKGKVTPYLETKWSFFQESTVIIYMFSDCYWVYGMAELLSH